MAAADVVVTVTDEVPLPGRGTLVFGTLAVDASPDTYATGGIALAAANFRGKVALSAEAKPRFMLIMGKAGYHYEYDRAGDKLLIRQGVAAGSPLAELSAAAVPATVSSDVVNFVAVFEKFPAV